LNSGLESAEGEVTQVEERVSMRIDEYDVDQLARISLYMVLFIGIV
jgi:hypothetical protein